MNITFEIKRKEQTIVIKSNFLLGGILAQNFEGAPDVKVYFWCNEDYRISDTYIPIWMFSPPFVLYPAIPLRAGTEFYVSVETKGEIEPPISIVLVEAR